MLSTDSKTIDNVDSAIQKIKNRSTIKGKPSGFFSETNIKACTFWRRVMPAVCCLNCAKAGNKVVLTLKIRNSRNSRSKRKSRLTKLAR